MRNILKVLISVITLVFTFQTSVNAATQSSVKTQQRIEDNTTTKNQIKEEVRLRVEERKAAQEAGVNQRKRERLEYHWRLLGKRLLATIDRLETLVERIESRVAKIKEVNPATDTSDIEEQLTEAKEILTDAKLKYDEAQAEMQVLLDAEDSKDAFEELRETISDIKDLLVDAHRILVSIIEDIKGLRVGNS